MKKLIYIFFISILSISLFAEDLKSVMGIEFGSSIEEAESILNKKNWRKATSLKEDNVGFSNTFEGEKYNLGIQKNYQGGTYGNISDLELHLFFLKQENNYVLYKVEFMDTKEQQQNVLSFSIEEFSKFADVLEALVTKYDWQSTQGTETIRELSKKFGYKPRQEIYYIDKNNSSVFFLRKESRSNFSGYIFRNLTEYLTFTYFPLNTIYENNLQFAKQKEKELRQQEAEEKEKLRLEQVNNLKGDL